MLHSESSVSNFSVFSQDLKVEVDSHQIFVLSSHSGAEVIDFLDETTHSSVHPVVGMVLEMVSSFEHVQDGVLSEHLKLTFQLRADV